MSTKSGKLILVPTPIGNLADITLRALEVLKTVDLILAEDTRTTGNLLKHLGIKSKMQSYHQHNERGKTNQVIELLEEGNTIALVSDAGTPGISDPGFFLVRECIENNIETECLPGATAFIPALVQSGIPCDRFIFEGFLPVKKGRNKKLESLKEETRTMVFYESPHRIEKFVRELGEHMGLDRQISVTKEISKVHETTWRGSIKEVSEALSNANTKGEFVVVLNGNQT
jgi:16S rRNA (cytidine1402-2'-O)-methyltransferase